MQYCINTTNMVEATEKAQAASIAKSNFLSNMSHEMRTPLNVISGMTFIAKEATEMAEKNNALNNIENASSHLLSLVNDILDMAKIEANKMEITPVKYNFGKMLQKTLSMVQFRVCEKNQTLTVNVDEAVPDYVVGDDKLLAQVLANLLFNASKFTAQGGEITLNVSLMRQSGQSFRTFELRIEVCDNGIGISEEEQKSLFGAFEQSSKGRCRKYGGTGLGLSIAKSFVELMGGKIWVESELGRGSKFIFTTSVAHKIENAAPQEAKELSSEKQNALSGKQILIVEDVAINRQILIKLLEMRNTGLFISYAEDGKQALDMVNAEPEKYDLIFMDIQMPQMDGLEATRQIRALPAESCQKIPIIAMSANVLKEDIENCIEAGMNEHLSKPINIDKVIEALCKHLGN
jgi:CheY-like chemotaxis protein